MTDHLAIAPAATSPASSAPRHDGWTLARQRRFCELLAEHGNVGEAARRVGMSKQSAYALRRRAAGAAFALGWDAAIGIARRRLVDDALELAMDGVHDIYSKDGEVVAERRRRDPRVMLAVAERLARLSDTRSEAARAVELRFDDYLDCLSRGGRKRKGADANGSDTSGPDSDDGAAMAADSPAEAPGKSARKALLEYFFTVAPHPHLQSSAFHKVDDLVQQLCGESLLEAAARY